MRKTILVEAGAARVRITPRAGAEMAGYAARTGPATGIHDDLHARCLVLRQGHTMAALIVTDLVGLGTEMGQDIRRRIQERTGIPADHVIVVSTHTHSGPVTDVFPVGGVMGTPDSAYLKTLRQRIVGAVETATRRLQPATFGGARGRVRVNVNRRGKAPKGAISLQANPDGVVDEEVGVVRIAGRNGRVLAHLVNYACHGVVLGAANRSISADYPGVVQRAMEAALGGIALFANGACGNLNPIVQAGSFGDVQRLGRQVAEDAIRAIEAVTWWAAPTLSIKTRNILLPCRRRIPERNLRRIVEREERRLKGLGASRANLSDRRIATLWLEWARNTLEQQRQGIGPKVVPLTVRALTLGPLALVAIPAELFAETGIRIKRTSPYPFTCVLGYADGVVGYLPTRAAMREGGYETWAYVVYGTRPFLPTAEGVLRRQIRTMLGQPR
ncbi:MAG: neutral/alkaline non-lysosomal ceramidase N-terminal domain-containing protein [Kiritimatiellae bacterium]|nr:neutral/alkaline non-lysosomal ceramidase N-terminal domain-containing protein [Kiritimatiellia bacterium]